MLAIERLMTVRPKREVLLPRALPITAATTRTTR